MAIGDASGALAAAAVDRHFAKQLPPGFNPFDDRIVFLRDVKAWIQGVDPSNVALS